jgi:hypothetical protein
MKKTRGRKSRETVSLIEIIWINAKFTVKKKPSVTQEHNMWAQENSVIHVGRGAQSMWMTDFSDLSMWMTELSVAHILCSCVTLGFCNSEVGEDCS